MEILSVTILIYGRLVSEQVEVGLGLGILGPLGSFEGTFVKRIEVFTDSEFCGYIV